MNNDLKDLYQEVIMDHNKSPCNFRKIDNPDCRAEGYNPMCGDHVVIYMKFRDGIIEDITFQGVGCALSQASASLMTEELKGKTQENAMRLFDAVHDMLTKDDNSKIDTLGKISALSGTYHFPMRVKCVTLAWHAMKDAINSMHT